MRSNSALLLDACSLINLVASGIPLADMAHAIGRQFIVTTFAAEESLFVSGLSDSDPAIPVGVEALATAGHLTITSLTTDELAQFIELAKSIDDGEASTLAVARARELDLATDDRRAIRVANEIGVNVTTTAQLVRLWAENSESSADEVSVALSNIERRGNFSPRREDPERAWWEASIGNGRRADP